MRIDCHFRVTYLITSEMNQEVVIPIIFQKSCNWTRQILNISFTYNFHIITYCNAGNVKWYECCYLISWSLEGVIACRYQDLTSLNANVYFISKILWHSHVCIWNRNGTGRKIAFENDILEMTNISVWQWINTYAVLHVGTQLTPHYNQQSWSQILITLHWGHNRHDASQITSLIIVYSTVYSGADERKQQSSASLAFVRGIDRWPVNSPQKWPVTRKMFPFDDVIMKAHIPALLIITMLYTCLHGIHRARSISLLYGLI